MAPIPATGYWMLMCNPAKFALDRFLTDHNTPEDIVPVSETRKDQFRPGQLGIIRVGADRRTHAQLKGQPRLVPGIYAIIEVLSEAKSRHARLSDQYWYDVPDLGTPVVEVQYMKNLLSDPVRLEVLKAVPDLDPKVLRAPGEASYPLTKYSFDLIAQLGGLDQAVWTNR